MKKHHLLLLFSLSFFKSTFAMENTEITHPVEIPDISRFIAYALVDVSKETPANLLSSILNFSEANKRIRATVFSLLCGYNNETGQPSEVSAHFNKYALRALTEHFTTQQLSETITPESSPECLAAAYIGTPFCLGIIKKEYEQSPDIEKFHKKLNREFKSTEQYFSDLVLMNHLTPPIVIAESLDATLKKFPPSTQKFFKKLIAEKPKEKTTHE